MFPSSDAVLLSRLRQADPDRHFATLFAPPAKRRILALLYLFNHELARAREVASNPILTLIRLQWWREVVEGQRKKHELALPLSDALEAGMLDRQAMLALISAREMEAERQIPDYSAFLDYARGTGGLLARTAGRLLGQDSQQVEDLGTAYAISGILRSAPLTSQQARPLLPQDGTSPDTLIMEAKRLLLSNPPRGVFAAWAPAAYVRRELGLPYSQRGPRDQLAVLWALIKGKP